MATVTLDSITKVYPSKRGPICAVDSVSLAVADREFAVLVGPSGCGKTTTLRMIAGLETIDAGTIRIGDRVVNNVAPKDRDIAMVFQNYALYPHMTVAKNMGFGLKMRKTPKAQIVSEVRQAAEMLGIEELLDRKPAALSGGERQRVAVGRAIVRRPQVFLFDEPLSNLDAKLRVRMRTEIKSLHQRLAATMVYVTHDQEEAMTLGDSLIVMCDGKVRQRGTPLEVYQNPADRFVAGFIGTPPMNFIEGRIVRVDDVLCFEGEGGLRLTLDAESQGAHSDQNEHGVVLGIRPQHISLENGSRNSDQSLCGVDVDVDVVELLGDRMHLHGATSTGQPITAQVGGLVPVKSGQRYRLQFDMARAHLFRNDDAGCRLGSKTE